MNAWIAVLFVVGVVMYLVDHFSSVAGSPVQPADWPTGTDCSEEDVPIVEKED